MLAVFPCTAILLPPSPAVPGCLRMALAPALLVHVVTGWDCLIPTRLKIVEVGAGLSLGAVEVVGESLANFRGPLLYVPDRYAAVSVHF